MARRVIANIVLTLDGRTTGSGRLFDAETTRSEWAFTTITPTDSGALHLVADRRAVR